MNGMLQISSSILLFHHLLSLPLGTHEEMTCINATCHVMKTVSATPPAEDELMFKKPVIV